MQSPKPRSARLLAALVAAVGLAASGCAAHGHGRTDRQAVRRGPRVVVIACGHHHTRRCGYYLHRDRWYHLRGHVHGRSCGHVRIGGVWHLR